MLFGCHYIVNLGQKYQPAEGWPTRILRSSFEIQKAQKNIQAITAPSFLYPFVPFVFQSLIFMFFGVSKYFGSISLTQN